MKKVYFIGIGGIGMSALAQYLKDQDVDVSGSDREASPVTALLEEKGISVHLTQKTENVPSDAEIIVYSEAVLEDNPERVRAKELGIEQVSYFEMLGRALRGKRVIAVAGTHGKTTTTGMLAKILHDAGASPSAIVGSIVKDFGSNYLSGTSDVLVVEACEYKNDFRFLSPQILVVTNIEWDHTDYYPDLASVQRAFRELMEKVPADGAIIADAKHPNITSLLGGLAARVVDYTQEPAYELQLPGEFNKMNARAAAAAARPALSCVKHSVFDKVDAVIRSSLNNFQGTWRRFEYKGKTKNGAEVYDDYAHHPTAVRATLEALRLTAQAGAKTSGPSTGSGRGKIFVAFHPHLYSRTRDLLDDFAKAFTGADGVFIAPIYAAREVDDGTVSSEILAKRITANGTPAEALSFDEIQKTFETYPGPGDTVITMGAGDIYKVADKLVAV
jgi:UDP-N-acetylmuramate--alanine ligase